MNEKYISFFLDSWICGARIVSVIFQKIVRYETVFLKPLNKFSIVNQSTENQAKSIKSFINKSVVI